MTREEVLLKSAGVIRTVAEGIAEAHTLSGVWGSDPDDQRAQQDHDECLELACLLVAMAKGPA